MEQLKQLFWILLFSFIGEFLSILSPVAIPGSVIGMVLLFIALHYKWLKVSQVEEVGNFLTDNMAIFFIPAGVGLMTNFNILGDVWWQLLITLVITTTLMLGFVGLVVQFMKRRAEGSPSKSKEKI